MNIKHIPFLSIVILFSIFLASCNSKNDTVEYSGLTNDAQIYSFSLVAPFVPHGDSISRAQDSLRIIEVNKRTYSIDQLSNIVYNQDSLPYLTNLKKVKVTATFNTAYGVPKVEIINKDSTYTWNTTDSIDFSKAPIYMRVYSWGGTEKRYHLDVRTHKIDPDLIVWNQMPALITTGKSKTLLYDNTFYSYILNNNGVILNKSPKSNIAWSRTSTTGLSSNMNIESFTVANDTINAIDKSGQSYISLDGVNWSLQNNGYNVAAVVGVIPSITSSQANDLLVVIHKNNNYYFAKGSSLKNISEVQSIEGSIVNTIPSNFPISSISSFSNEVSFRSDRMLVVAGGISGKNITVTNRWLIKNTQSGIELTSFVQKPIFTTNAGLSIFPYNKLFYVLNSKAFYISDNKGETWSVAPAQQTVNSQMKSQSGQTVIVDTDNYIWIIGGESSQGVFVNEVWRGRLNSLIP